MHCVNPENHSGLALAFSLSSSVLTYLDVNETLYHHSNDLSLLLHNTKDCTIDLLFPFQKIMLICCYAVMFCYGVEYRWQNITLSAQKVSG